MTTGKLRATISQDGVGFERYELFKEGYRRISDAQEHSYFLEAITLIESMLSDRLESRLGELTNADQPFQNLGGLLKRLSDVEQDVVLASIMQDRIDPWRIERNFAIHEMMKIQSGKNEAWGKRQQRVKRIASDGLAILRAFDSKLRSLRRKRRRE